MRYDRAALIAGLILIGLILSSFFLRVWPFGKSKHIVPELALQHLVRDKAEGPLLTGPLLEDERFIKVLPTSMLQEIYDAKQKLCLVPKQACFSRLRGRDGGDFFGVEFPRLPRAA